MSAIHIDAADVRLRVPVLRLGRLRALFVVQVEATGRGRGRTRTRRSAGYDAAVERIERHRTDALAHRRPGL